MQLESIPFVINIFLGLVLLVVMLSNGLSSLISNKFLLALIVIVLGYQCKAVVVLEDQYHNFPHLIKLFLPFHFLIGPLFFFYVKHSLNASGQSRNSMIRLLHYVPFLIVALALFPFYIKSGAEKLALHSAPKPGNFEIGGSMLIYYLPLLISLLFYSLKSVQLTRRSDNLGDHRKSGAQPGKLQWLTNYSYVFLFFACLYSVAQFIFIFTDFRQFYVMLVTVFSSSIFVHFLAFWALKRSGVIDSESQKKTSTHSAPQDLFLQKKAEILSLLQNEKIYLDRDLTATKFANRLDINTTYLSQIINREFGHSLTQLINTYRIEYAKRILSDESYQHLNFLGIATQSGFNSANSFRRVFKKHTGKNPSEYKKEGTTADV